jgi:hypothetical protein
VKVSDPESIKNWSKYDQQHAGQQDKNDHYKREKQPTSKLSTPHELLCSRINNQILQKA